jgi:hypothetical protein
MRPHLHKKALARLAVAASAAGLVPAMAVAVGGAAAAPVAVVAGGVIVLLGFAGRAAPRRRATGRARAQGASAGV